MNHEQKHTVLALLKDNRDQAILQYTSTDDEVLKNVYREEIEKHGKLYRTKAEEFANSFHLEQKNTNNHS